PMVEWRATTSRVRWTSSASCALRFSPPGGSSPGRSLRTATSWLEPRVSRGERSGGTATGTATATADYADFGDCWMYALNFFSMEWAGVVGGWRGRGVRAGVRRATREDLDGTSGG